MNNVITNPQWSARNVYDIWHESLEIDPDATSPWYRVMREHLDPVRDLLGKRVLEIGCGRGDFCCWLGGQAERPLSIVAADFSLTAVQKGRSFAAKHAINVTWEVMDIQAIAQPDASFDTVISCETIEHVCDPFKAVRELARVLKPGGYLFLTTPNYLSPMGLYRGYLRLRGRHYTETGQPVNHFTMLPRTLIWVKRAGLRIRRIDAIGHYLLLPGRAPMELSRLNNPRFLMRWFGLHSLVVAQKV